MWEKDLSLDFNWIFLLSKHALEEFVRLINDIGSQFMKNLQGIGKLHYRIQLGLFFFLKFVSWKPEIFASTNMKEITKFACMQKKEILSPWVYAFSQDWNAKGTQTLWMEYMHSALCVLKCNKILKEDPFYAFHSPAAEQAASCVIPSPPRWDYIS